MTPDIHPVLELLHVSKTYPGGSVKAVDNISLSVEKGAILALVGESGSGKTTLLRTIAGLEVPDEGSLILSGQVISEGRKAVPVHKRNIGMVFQDYALFPHMTIAENIGFGLKGMTQAEKKRIIGETLALTNLEENPGKYPHQLSGGQQQRVALARALAPKPEILLLDEPFSNLDSILHDRVREDLRKIVKATGITTILVTHHTRDALSMADQVAVIHKGRLLQMDAPGMIYNHPVSGYVANLFGKYSCINCIRTEGGMQTPFGEMPAGNTEISPRMSRLFCRPEHITVLKKNSPLPAEGSVLTGVVEAATFLGDHVRIEVKPENAQKARLILHADTFYEPGTNLRFIIRPYKFVDFGDPEAE